jgi:hypothetical protein
VQILPKFPALFGDGEAIPSDLIGATIVQIGAAERGDDSEEFAIEYRPAGQSRVKLALMQFNERGMWLDPKFLHNHVPR